AAGAWRLRSARRKPCTAASTGSRAAAATGRCAGRSRRRGGAARRRGTVPASARGCRSTACTDR
nr:hypothetical protein [Tanacetum cinerariifolium]